MNSNAVCYLFVYDKILIPGVHKKIIGTLDSIKKKGYSVRQFSCDKNENPSFFRLLIEIIKCKEKYVIVRSIYWLNFLLVPFLIIARLQGKILYCDVPTSFKSAIFEVFGLNVKFYIKLKYLIGLFLGTSWSLWPYNYILTYSEDYPIFKIWQAKKTIFLTNSISIDHFKSRNNMPVWPSSNLNLIAVAFVSNYHGYDRVIKAMHIWNNKNNYKINFNIVGDGDAIPELVELVKKFNLEKFVTFTGILPFDKIFDLYKQSHIAIGSIGLHRKKMLYHSELKAREYTAVGIPFIASGIDLDFSSNEKFRIVISSDNSINDLIDVFENIDSLLENLNSTYITDYACKNLTFDSKFSSLRLPQI
jgi:hypothetical protein